MKTQIDIANMISKLDHIHRVDPPATLVQKMESMAAAYGLNTQKYDLRSMVGIAASVLLLISLNFFMLESRISVSNEGKTISTSYTLTPNNTLYNE